MSEPIESDPTNQKPIEGDQRLALCLSGGGYRAALFHLGALRRLNEQGVLSKVDTIASVSGGSILAAHLATQMPWPEPGATFAEWQNKVELPFLAFVKRNIRTWPVLKRWLFPWNWFRPSVPVKTLEATYFKHLTRLRLTDLPDRPRFIFCATDMVHGVSWYFEKARVGSYRATFVEPDQNFTVAMAVAASSCFPPVFSPLPVELPPGRSRQGWAGMSASDGGLYDNLGLQPAEDHGTVLASDGGLPFVPAVPNGVLGRAKAYLAISGKQAGSLRRRNLIAEFEDEDRQGTYWGVGSAVASFDKAAKPGYSKAFATEVIARIRTDMDAFSDAEIAVLMNHGYLLADIAIQVHAKQLISLPAEKKEPYPEWMDEGKAREGLKDSSKRSWVGR